MRNSEENYSSGFDFCKKYLASDEYVLWQGRPEKGNIFSYSDIFTTLFSIMWLSFSVFWEYLAIKDGSSFFMMLWGIPFVAIGVYMLIGRFIQKIIMRNKTFYVVTNKRIIIKKGSRIKFYDPKDLPPMNIIIHKNGNGTISYTETLYSGRYRTVRYCALENLADVTKAQQAINSINSDDPQRFYDESTTYYSSEQAPLNSPESRSKRSPMAVIIPIIIIVAMIIGGISFFSSIKSNDNVTSSNQTDVSSQEIDFRDVITILKGRGYETDNIAPTYGYQDEIHLANVAAGIKGDSKFEFYEYTQDGNPDGVYDTITFGYTQNMTVDELSQYETELKGNGKKFTFVQNGTLIVVAYKNNTVIYAQSPENSTEIQDIMSEIGYV